MKKELKYLMIIAAAVTAIGFVAVIALFGFEVKPESKSIGKNETPSYPMITNLVAVHSFSHGPKDAKVTVVEFFDPECESCAMVSPYIKKEMKFYEGKVQWVFRYMPLHRNSKAAVAALEAARKQNLFVEAMELLFEKQKEWGEQQEPMNEKINQILFGLNGLNKDQYLKDLANQNIDEILKQDEIEGRQAGVKGTPTFFVNNKMLEALDLDSLIAKINEGLNQ